MHRVNDLVARERRIRVDARVAHLAHLLDGLDQIGDGGELAHHAVELAGRRHAQAGIRRRRRRDHSSSSSSSSAPTCACGKSARTSKMLIDGKNRTKSSINVKK